MINIKMQTTDTQNLSPKIAVIGVGGAGGNAVNNMISSNLDGCEFLVCNTDAQALEKSLCENKIQIGVGVTGGLGAGSKPEIGKAAAEESLEELMQHLDGSNMAFVTAGMGGGTGTGAAPIIAKACRERGILTVGVVTKPFHFEGSHRMKMADAGLEEMQSVVDTLIVIPNQNLFRIANEKTTFSEAFQMADGVLQSGVRGVTDLMVRPGLVNLDFADVRTAMLEMGKAMMGTGEASGEKRAIEAAESAINNPLLDDVSMKGARGVIINVTGGYDMTLFEADEACNRVRDEVDPDANIIFGATFDENMDGVMRVSIVATGIEAESSSKTKTGGGNIKMGGSVKHTLERANPDTDVAATAAPLPATSFVAAPTSPYTSASDISGITALGQNNITPSYDPELDMFEQQQFTESGGGGRQNMNVPQNTALRGARYKNSFIPPVPAIAGRSVEDSLPPSVPAQQQTPGFHGNAGSVDSSAMQTQTASSSGLKLNPPRIPSEPVRKSPSLFERISGTVQQHIEGVIGGGENQQQQPRTAPSPQPLSGTLNTQQSPAQGSLNISSPSAKPTGSATENELDIPAFLRRQAN